MTPRIPFICNCGQYPVILQIGAYCEVCQAFDEDAVDEADEPELPDPRGDAYDRARDMWEEISSTEVGKC